MMQLKNLKKKEQIKTKSSKQSQIIKMRAEINKMEQRQYYKKSIVLGVGSLRGYTRLNGLLVHLIKRNRGPKLT